MATVICLHCSASSARQWAALAATLAPRHSVLAPALIGYDAEPPCTSGDVTLDREAERIEVIVAAAREPVCLVGHSYGAAVATRVALRRRDRIAGLAVYEPALFSLIPGGAGTGGAEREIAATALAVCDAVRAGGIDRAAGRFVDYWSGDGAWRKLDERRREAVRVRMPKVALEFGALFGDRVRLSAYARLTMPVLVLEGESTLAPTRTVARRLLSVLPDAQHVMVAGAGHMGPLTHAAAVNAEIVRFVTAIGEPRRRVLAA